MVALVRMQARARSAAKGPRPAHDREIHVPISLDDDRLGDRVGAAARAIGGFSASR
jgi:hypothetical protein